MVESQCGLPFRWSLEIPPPSPEQRRRVALAAGSLAAKPADGPSDGATGSGIIISAGASSRRLPILDIMAAVRHIRSCSTGWRPNWSEGWSLKHVHRLILTSVTYRQSSAPRPDGLKVDADAQILWRFAPRRLEAEAIRDSMLAASGVSTSAWEAPDSVPFSPIRTTFASTCRKKNLDRRNGGGWSTCRRCGWNRTRSSARSIALTPADCSAPHAVDDRPAGAGTLQQPLYRPAGPPDGRALPPRGWQRARSPEWAALRVGARPEPDDVEKASASEHLVGHSVSPN